MYSVVGKTRVVSRAARVVSAFTCTHLAGRHVWCVRVCTLHYNSFHHCSVLSMLVCFGASTRKPNDMIIGLVMYILTNSSHWCMGYMIFHSCYEAAEPTFTFNITFIHIKCNSLIITTTAICFHSTYSVNWCE